MGVAVRINHKNPGQSRLCEASIQPKATGIKLRVDAVVPSGNAKHGGDRTGNAEYGGDRTGHVMAAATTKTVRDRFTGNVERAPSTRQLYSTNGQHKCSRKPTDLSKKHLEY